MVAFRRTVILAAVLVAGSCPAALSAKRFVPDDHPTIQAAIDAAAAFDTVVVRAGTYREVLTLAGKNLVLIGESGRDATVVTAGRAGRVLTVGAGVSAATVVSGFTLAEGQAEPGGGILVPGGSGLTVRDCRLSSNWARRADGAPARGGGLFLDRGASAAVDGCEFRANGALFGDLFSDGFGGAVYVSQGATLRAADSRFVRNLAAGLEGGWGGAVEVAGGAARFTSCAFDSQAAGYGGAIDGWGELLVELCVFRANQSTYGASTVSFSPAGGFVVTGSAFHDNRAFSGPTFEVRGAGEVRGNTFAFNGTDGGAYGCVVGAGIALRNNIIASNDDVGFACFAPAAVECNDIWDNRGGNYGGQCPDLTGFFGNISADPLFCYGPGRLLTLKPASPCAPRPPCGLIGAFGAGCPPAAAGGVPAAGDVELHPVRPNPARAAAVIGFRLAVAANVRLEIVDIAGRRAALLENGVLAAGTHRRTWDRPPGVRPGVYVVRLAAGRVTLARKLVLAD